ncbi:unnamed protein product [Linum trigynum]|uniref:Uncharacterized protein n=1 Tax=Linum trigynum TaxID=586398 RepID=A0AAV2FBY5_9ROSI
MDTYKLQSAIETPNSLFCRGKLPILYPSCDNLVAEPSLDRMAMTRIKEKLATLTNCNITAEDQLHRIGDQLLAMDE